VGKGAAFIKVLGPDFSFSKSLHAVPTFGYCPTYITGGVTRERMHEAFAAGNVLCAAGFDVVLKGEDPETITPERVAELLRSFVETAKAARAEVNPKFQSMEKMSDEFIEDIKVKGNYLLGQLKLIDNVRDADGLGLMIGFNIEGADPAAAAAKCLEKGLIVLTAHGKIRLLPPLIISKEEIDKGIGIIRDVAANI
jgi:hypothetical protein